MYITCSASSPLVSCGSLFKAASSQQLMQMHVHVPIYECFTAAKAQVSLFHTKRSSQRIDVKEQFGHHLDICTDIPGH